MSEAMGYLKKDVDAAEARIRAAVPDVMVNRPDFGFGLAVARPNAKMSYLVFRPERHADREDEGHIHQTQVVSDAAAIDEIIARLTA